MMMPLCPWIGAQRRWKDGLTERFVTWANRSQSDEMVRSSGEGTVHGRNQVEMLDKFLQ